MVMSGGCLFIHLDVIYINQRTNRLLCVCSCIFSVTLIQV